MHMKIANIVAERSTCRRLNVGALIVIDGRIRSIGYNGQPPGKEHCKGADCPGMIAGNCPTIHAELNALNHLALSSSAPMDLYVTNSPCVDCLAIASFRGVTRVFFQTPYRVIDHLSSEHNDVLVYQVMPSGYLINWKTNTLVDPEEIR